MPIYEYRCSACGFQKEFLQRLNDAPHTVCPECRKSTFNKLVTAAGFHLKGTGWYATDFKNSGARPAAKKAEDGSAKEATGKDTSSKESSGKESSNKESSNKDSSGKDSSNKEASKSGSKTDTSPAS